MRHGAFHFTADDDSRSQKSAQNPAQNPSSRAVSFPQSHGRDDRSVRGVHARTQKEQLATAFDVSMRASKTPNATPGTVIAAPTNGVVPKKSRHGRHWRVGELPRYRSITGVLSRAGLIAVGALVALMLAAATPGNGASKASALGPPIRTIVADEATASTSSSSTSTSSTSTTKVPKSSTSSSSVAPSTSVTSSTTKAPTTTTKAPTTTTRLPATTQPKPRDTGVIGNDVWTKLAQCESGNRNLASGPYYGYFQFSLSTWQALGGTGKPSDHTYEEQKAIAIKLQARSGWGQWPACSRKIGVA